MSYFVIFCVMTNLFETVRRIAAISCVVEHLKCANDLRAWVSGLREGKCRGNKRKHFTILDRKGDAMRAINFIDVTDACAISSRRKFRIHAKKVFYDDH